MPAVAAGRKAPEVLLPGLFVPVFEPGEELVVDHCLKEIAADGLWFGGVGWKSQYERGLIGLRTWAQGLRQKKSAFGGIHRRGEGLQSRGTMGYRTGISVNFRRCARVFEEVSGFLSTS